MLRRKIEIYGNRRSTIWAGFLKFEICPMTGKMLRSFGGRNYGDKRPITRASHHRLQDLMSYYCDGKLSTWDDGEWVYRKRFNKPMPGKRYHS